MPAAMRGRRDQPRVVVVGAGIGGLAAAADLARRGAEVTVCERAATVGGKIRRVRVGDAAIDAGPTVFTMRWIFEGLFADAGLRLEDELDLTPADVLARHVWRAGGTLDLHADIGRSADAIAALAGAAEAAGYRRFCADSAAMYRTLVGPFIASERPSMTELAARVGFRNLSSLWRTAPTRTLWSALGDYFRDRRLRQLFGRYATYVGASPYLAPATLMLIAHVEQDGVWLVKGGIHRVAEAIQALATRQGARFRFGAEMAEIQTGGGKVTGIVLADGERIGADAVIFNGDISALPDPLRPVPATRRLERSLSAAIWCLNARVSGFDLAHHNVVFADDYAEEFDALFKRRTITASPTVYLCAQDRGAGDAPAAGRSERLLALVNAPADGDTLPPGPEEIAALGQCVFSRLAQCGLVIDPVDGAPVVTTPAGFHALFPATGGALYGRANHGASGSFQRAGAIGRVPGLYLAGGSVHPGPGVPMALLSGRLAAARLLEDFADGGRRRRTISFAPP